ncbi:MAG: hapE 3 [Alphaproteobacteria bacterium]|nr:hapE 3 [Alphaproteobacteria bacterium]
MFDFKEIVSDEATLRAALAVADTVPLALSQAQLAGDGEFLERLRPHVNGPWDYSENIPPELKAETRERLIATLKDYAAAGRALPPPPKPELLQTMMALAAGQAIPDEYAPMLLEQSSVDGGEKERQWRKPADRDFSVAIVGAGMSGIGMAIKLQQAGIPFTIFEKNATVGGTWYENFYPGCGVDTPNHFYSFSFELFHDWTHFFSKRDALWQYFERLADKHDLRRHIRFNTEVTSAQYDEARQTWKLRAKRQDGTEENIEANALISAVGQLNRPSVPKIAGLETFKGPAFHTGKWDHSADIAGKNVAMIGTGASGMQVGPTIAPLVEKLSIFQRSPHWVVPNPNYHRSVKDEKKWVLRHIPFYVQWYRFQLFWGFADGLWPALQKDPSWDRPAQSLNATNERYRINMVRHIEREVGERKDLLPKVVPNYPPYGKRILIDNHWYKMLTRDNVELVTDHIDHVEADGVVTKDGNKHPADVIVLATGFQAGRMLWPMEIKGKSGRSLRDVWGEDDPRAYLGVTVPDFPNLFIMYGPNTNLGHGGSAIFHAECQIRYIMDLLHHMMADNLAAVEVRADVHDDYNARVDAAHERMVWTHGGMSNWYKNAKGRVIANSPWRLVDYWKMTSRADLRDYVVQRKDGGPRIAA